MSLNVVKEIPFKKWFFFALLVRVIAIYTNTSYSHPDEWYQTVEIGNFLAFGFKSWTFDSLAAHLRNLSWPSFLAVILTFSNWISDHSVSLRLFMMRATAAAADLVMLVGMLKVVRNSKLTPEFRNFAWALWLLPFFTVADSVRPSMEHLSEVFLWCALGAISGGSWYLGGFFSALIGVVRYPSLLFTLGIILMLLLRRTPFKDLSKYAFGLFIGVVLGGLADFWFYGRPYESFYFYLQYNVLSGLGAQKFGTQGVIEYYRYFEGHWGGFLAPMGIFLAVVFPFGLLRALKNFEPWAGALLIYGLGHLLIGHKEPRFMDPLESLMLWSAVHGLQNIVNYWLGRKWQIPQLINLTRAVIGIFLLVNGAYLARALWGDLFRPNQVYEEIDRHLKNHPGVCALVTIVRPMSSKMPWKSVNQVPEPTYGFFPVRPHTALTEDSPDVKDRPLIWMDHAPNCNPKDSVLIHLSRPSRYWEEKQKCEMLSSGVFRFVPKKYWAKVIEKNWASSAWYKCPAGALSIFGKVEVRRLLARQMAIWDALPPLNISADELDKQIQAKIEPGIQDGTLGEF